MAGSKGITSDDLINMSDEELSKVTPDQLADEPDFKLVAEGDAPDPDDEVEDEPEVEEEEDQPEPEDTSETEEEESDEPEPEVEEPEEIEDPKTVPAKNQDEPEDKSQDAPGEAEPAKATDYKEIHDRIFAPFKANGKDFSVKNVDEVVTLMQQGANFNKKMATLKPHLRTLRTLEQAGITEPEQINRLIDLHDKKPEAITQLLKDAKMDPLDIDVEADTNYQPTNHTIDESQMALDNVLDELQTTPTYDKLLKTVGKQWDDSSRQIIGKDPSILQAINDHMASGIYDVIDDEVQRRRTLGQLKGLTDLAAYKQTGDDLDAKGAFKHLVQPTKANEVPAIQPLPSKRKNEDPKLAQKRKAASSGKAGTSAKGKGKVVNPLSLSDEEFQKQYSEHLR